MPTLQTHPKTSPEEVLQHLSTCCRALEDKKAEDLTVLDMRGTFDVTDYFLLATGTSEPHLRASSKKWIPYFSKFGYQIPSKSKTTTRDG